jgi:hypothetical protein
VTATVPERTDPYGSRCYRDRLTWLAALKLRTDALGVRWSDVRAWALANGWKPAEVPPNTKNPVVIEAYLKAHEEEA